MLGLDSRTVDWWSVHQYVLPMLSEAGGWPLAGSPAWQQLEDDDPRKLAAVLDGARRDALRNETAGTVLAEASRAVAAAADWSAIANRLCRGRGSAYISRRTV